MADLIKKDIRYLSRDFNSLKSNLIDFAKNYFPDTYQDFNEASPGMMFMEMAAYVGDVLSFYTDVNLQESMILHASEKRNIINLAQSLGYTPKLNSSSTVKLDIFQLVPSKTSGTEIVPDMSYAMAIEPGMIAYADYDTSGNNSVGAVFRTTEYLDFKFSGSFSPLEITPFEVDEITGEITFWLLKKQVNAVSGRIVTQDFIFNEPKKYDKVVVEDKSLIEFLYAMDKEGNRWDYVPFLAQDTVYEAVPNIPRNDKNMSFYRNETPYLLKLKKLSRKFTVRYGSDGRHEIMFGPGVSNVTDEEFIPNPDLVGNSLTGIETSPSLDIDPSNFLRTKTYGLSPSNTTLTLYYTAGSGILDNVGADTINRIGPRNILLDKIGLDDVLYNQVISSLAITNPEPASGGKNEEDVNEIRQNALAHFAAQNRAVTKEDYIIRAYSMPQKYGSIAKAYITRNTQLTYDDVFYSDRRQNNLALGFYVLGYDSFGKLNNINPATKENLKTYLNEYRILTDAIEVKDAYVINIGIEFDIITLPDKNGNEVIIKCIDRLKKYFDIKKWQINQPIVISNVYTELDRIEGVQTVVSVKFKNLHDQTLGYSMHMYDIEGATKNGVIFPSLDPSIFEIKYPDNDILGRVRAF
jgi:hypothetical protein